MVFHQRALFLATLRLRAVRFARRLARSAISRWPTATTSDCASTIGSTSERNAAPPSSPIANESVATRISGESLLSVIAITAAPRLRNVGDIDDLGRVVAKTDGDDDFVGVDARGELAIHAADVVQKLRADLELIQRVRKVGGDRKGATRSQQIDLRCRRKQIDRCVSSRSSIAC